MDIQGIYTYIKGDRKVVSQGNLVNQTDLRLGIIVTCYMKYGL